MPHLTNSRSSRSGASRHHWRRELTELAGVFGAVATADTVANLVVHGPDGPILLIGSAVGLLATAGFHTWWSRRRGHSPPEDGAPDTAAAGAPAAAEGTAAAEDRDDDRADTLWRMRTTVRDEPGSLAALCAALAALRVDILTLQTHPLADGTVDEFLLRVSADTPPGELTRAAASGGGRDTWIERADAHDLVDTPTRMLSLATRTAMDAAELPLALRQLFGRCTIRSAPACADGEGDRHEDVLDGTVMRLRDPAGGTITVERLYLPFTPTEFARARALVELDARLGPRLPDSKDVLAYPGGSLPEGDKITVRRAGPEDIAAVRAMHARCSDATLTRRYHGPVADVDRYLEHLLSPRFGQSLAVETASGTLVAVGHLLWDGDENEVALIVEDAWQRRGIGSELLRRLSALAREAGGDSVYAVTQTTNTSMVAAMRGLGVPLDYQVEETTLVITAALAPVGAPSPAR